MQVSLKLTFTKNGLGAHSPKLASEPFDFWEVPEGHSAMASASGSNPSIVQKNFRGNLKFSEVN